MRALLRLTALVATLALTLSACSAPVIPEPSLPPESIPTELAPFYNQDITWQDCYEAMECAVAKAPIDWSNPQGQTLELAMVRHVASSSDRLGSLFVNPGGPGASGVDFIANSLDYAVSKDVQKNYDVIGFDPRGVGQSTPVTCVDSDAEMDEYLYGFIDAPRESPEWFAERSAATQAFAQDCAEKSGALLEHVDTISAARDLDMLRYLVGDRQLNYLGYSYGTLLGAIYAETFPANAGRMVLDGALNPASSSFDVTVTQAQGFEKALRAYLADCLSQSSCPFRGSVDQAMQSISELLSQLDKDPLAASDGRLLGADAMVTAIIAPLYDKEAWGYLSDIFTAVFEGDADPAFAAADWYYNRSEAGVYGDNSTEAFIAINCLDYPTETDQTQWALNAEKLKSAAPVIGPYLAWGEQSCAIWPAPAVLSPGEVSASGSGDILVIGTTGDPATPYRWAQELAAQLDHGHLITYVGEGHTAYNKSNSCVKDAVDTFLLRGTVPAKDLRC